VAEQPTGQRCENCRYWLGTQRDSHYDDARDDVVMLGYCRARAPRRLGPSDEYGLFALTAGDEWCGEYAPANPETVTEGAATMARLVLLGDLTAARALADKLKEGDA
jgi:hypothetical protein